MEEGGDQEDDDCDHSAQGKDPNDQAGGGGESPAEDLSDEKREQHEWGSEDQCQATSPVAAIGVILRS